MYAGNSRINKDDPLDYYATEPKAVELLLEQENFTDTVWECACGKGHIVTALAEHGHWVISTDIVDRGFGCVKDFFDHKDPIRIDIITNPPYNKAQEFVEHALEIAQDGVKVAMFLKLTFLEGQKRRELFKKSPPRTVYVSSSRLQCGKNGDFSGSSAVAYAWFVWEKGYKGETTIKWIN
jgi:hypothetical protein